MNELNADKKQVLIGSVLGDGYLIENGQNCYFEETHSIKQEDYLQWKRNYFPKSKISYRVFNNYKLGKKYQAVKLRAPNAPHFTELREVFYPNGKKVLPKELLNKINELGLTVWYLDDGHINLLSNLINISTDNYSFDENYLIKEFLEKKWGMKVKVAKRKNKYYLTFDRIASDKMLSILEKIFEKYCIPESLKYKLGRLWEGNKEKLEEEKRKKNKYKKAWRAKKRKTRLKEKSKKQKERLDRIKELYYKKEKSLYEVAQELGYGSHVTILKIMKKHRLKRRNLSEACSGDKNGFFGKRHSKETKKKISKAKKKKGD